MVSWVQTAHWLCLIPEQICREMRPGADQLVPPAPLGKAEFSILAGRNVFRT